MSEPLNKITVLADGEQWEGSHDADQYLVSDKVLEDLQDGVKPFRIESSYQEGKDWINLTALRALFKEDAKHISDLENTFTSITDLMNIQAACNPSEKERGKLLNMIDALTIADLEDQLELFEEDIAGVMLDKMYQTISGE